MKYPPAYWYKAKKVLNWVPEHSDLNTIIDTAWKWYKSETYLRSN